MADGGGLRRPGTTVISLMWGNAWEQYGENFAETFARYWPGDVDLIVISDRPLPLRRGRCLPMANARGLAEFRDRHGGKRLAHGFDRPAGAKVDARGYSWRHDAIKWAPQAFAPELAAAQLPDDELMVWLDADVLTYRAIPHRFVDGLLGDAELCHLGRVPKHSEIGFWACRLNNRVRGFVSAFADQYRTDDVFKLKEWHSAYVFDACADALRNIGGNVVDLTPGGNGHVWFQSPLGRYTDHLKGKRKAAGQSPERA